MRKHGIMAVALAASSAACSMSRPADLGPQPGDTAREVPHEWMTRPVPGGAAEVELVARGAEADAAWSLTIVSGEGIVLERPDGRVVFPYQPAVRDGRRIAWASSGGAPVGHRMVLRIAAKECTDPASGEVFSHTAYLRLDGKGLSGCARPGAPAAAD